MFTISFETIDPIICVVPDGRLDTINSGIFNEQIRLHLEKEQFLVIDFSRCNYLASSGIRSLMAADRQLRAKGGRLMLSGVSDGVFQILEISGLHQAFGHFPDKEAARQEIARLRNKSGVSKEITVGKLDWILTGIETNKGILQEWKDSGIAGLNELGFAIGTGSPAESLERDSQQEGIFASLANCICFLPFRRDLTPEFRVYNDPSAGGVFVNEAVAGNLANIFRVSLKEEGEVAIGGIASALTEMASKEKLGTARMFAALGASNGKVALVLVRFIEGALTGAVLHLDNPPDPAETRLENIGRELLTLDTISGLVPLVPDAILVNPVVWLFTAEETQNADDRRIRVEIAGDTSLEPWMAFLTRRLYTDSSTVVVKPLHGGYSAQTYQVESYDHEGRKLRPTVLKIAHRDLINREGERCQKFAMPYILNNSAIILGTAFYCNMGALRYNFVGIGGEETRLEWLARYFHSWPVEELEPLFDKIFLQILKPWYGQPVRKKIKPYLDHDPTLTFFTKLCETAEAELGIATGEKYVTFENGQKLINPYWFLRYGYTARREHVIDYYTAICHGDLNMQNILLDAAMNVYLIDFSETKPRSAVSDFARLEAIFMVEHAPVTGKDDLGRMMDFMGHFYENSDLSRQPVAEWMGSSPEIVGRNCAMARRMRQYALKTVSDDNNIVPYYMAMLEWVLPIVCYGGVDVRIKKLSAYVSGLLCGQILDSEG